MGTLALAYNYWQKRRSKSTGDLQSKVEQMSSGDNASIGTPGAPSMYGWQMVVQDQMGIWKLAPGTCHLVETGIVDWDAIKRLSQSQKDQLYADLGNCKVNNLPLIQPV